jgi:hypothetical protein
VTWRLLSEPWWIYTIINKRHDFESGLLLWTISW